MHFVIALRVYLSEAVFIKEIIGHYQPALVSRKSQVVRSRSRIRSRRGLSGLRMSNMAILPAWLSIINSRLPSPAVRINCGHLRGAIPEKSKTAFAVPAAVSRRYSVSSVIPAVKARPRGS